MNFSRKPTVKKKQSRSLFYRISAWLHLWLGLITGIVMIIVCVTACIWVFHDEITRLLEPETVIARQDKPVITPSQVREIAAQKYPKLKPGYVTYQQGNAIYLSLGEGRKGNTVLRLNPYSGEVISVKEHKAGETDFFRFILNGHRFLWMPSEIGKTDRQLQHPDICNYPDQRDDTLVAAEMDQKAREQSFRIKWDASFKRVNYDLHNVLGFYSLLVLTAIALTGMVYGIKWYSNGLYWVTSGGQTMEEFKRPQSDSTQLGKLYTPEQAMDLAWGKVLSKHPDAEGFYYSFADTSKPKAAIGITIYPTAGKFYNNRSYSFDQHTLKELAGNKVYDISFAEAGFGAKLRKANYDIHVGSILGLPGKILAFFGALIGASLPVTGFLVWWGKKKKTKKSVATKKAPAASTPQAV